MDERQSILVPVVLKALIDMGLVSVETTVCRHMGIRAIEKSDWRPVGEGAGAESLSSLKGYRTGVELERSRRDPPLNGSATTSAPSPRVS